MHEETDGSLVSERRRLRTQERFYSHSNLSKYKDLGGALGNPKNWRKKKEGGGKARMIFKFSKPAYQHFIS